MLPQRAGYIDGGWHYSNWFSETLRIGRMFQDYGMMNGHSILGEILGFFYA